MSSKLVRSNVYVITNEYGGVYEATDNPDIMKVMLEQTSVWWEKDKLKREVRQVEYFTDIALYKKGTVLPGNILVCYTTEPITDEEEFLHTDKWSGEISRTPEGVPIYTYYYYSAMSKFSCDAILDEDDVLGHLTTPSSI